MNECRNQSPAGDICLMPRNHQGMHATRLPRGFRRWTNAADPLASQRANEEWDTKEEFALKRETRACNLVIDREFMNRRQERAKGYPKAKWIEFCEAMLDRGYTCELREAVESVSKYITVFNLGLRFTVRYSNHGATRQPNDPCDFFVGKNSFGTTNTAQAIEATVAALGESPLKPIVSVAR